MDLPNPRIELRSPTLQAGSLPAEPPGKPKNTAVGSLSLSPGDLPDPGIEPGSPELQVDSLPAELTGKPKMTCVCVCVCVCVSHSVVSDSATPWTVAYQAPPSMGYSRQEYWSGLTFLSPGDLPNPRIELRSPALQTDFLPAEH